MVDREKASQTLASWESRDDDEKERNARGCVAASLYVIWILF